MGGVWKKEFASSKQPLEISQTSLHYREEPALEKKHNIMLIINALLQGDMIWYVYAM